MRRWLLPADATDASRLRTQDVAVPEPGPGQVRVAVSALSINARDRMVLQGPFGRIPGMDLVPLSDVAGTVDAVAGDVSGWAIGDRVTTAHVGTWSGGRPVLFGIGAGSGDDPGVAAEQIVVDAHRLVHSPDHLSDAEASTLQVAGVTAWNSVFGAHPVLAGDRVLVLGSGGVSIFAVQLALAVGAQVHVAVRGAAGDERLRELGVSSVISTSRPGWGAGFASSTGGADKIIDSVGPGLINECLAAAAPGAEVAVPGLIDVTETPLDAMTLIGAQASLRGVAVGSIEMHGELSRFIEQHRLHPVISERLSFEELPRAYEGLGEPGVFGKIVIEVG